MGCAQGATNESARRHRRRIRVGGSRPCPAGSGTAASAPAGPGQTCMSQHVEAPGMSAAALITRGFDIKAAVPGGLWVQKDREVYFCNSGRALDNDVLCWRLREPVK